MTANFAEQFDYFIDVLPVYQDVAKLLYISQ